MLSMLRKSAASMAKNGGSKSTDQYDVVEDLSKWEFVSSSLSDDEDLYSFDGDGIISDGDDAIGDGQEGNHEEEEDSRDILRLDDVISMESLSVSPQPVACFPVEYVMRLHAYVDDEVDDDVDGIDDDDDDVDDELIPWKLKDKFGKQRIRKMGKRGGPKVGKSKRLPHYHNRPGCLYGKHGLGVQHSYI